MALANRPFNHLGGWRLALQPVIRLPAASPFLLCCQRFPGFRVPTIKGHSIIPGATGPRPGRPGCRRRARRCCAPGSRLCSAPSPAGACAACLPRLCCFCPQPGPEFGGPAFAGTAKPVPAHPASVASEVESGHPPGNPAAAGSVTCDLAPTAGSSARPPAPQQGARSSLSSLSLIFQQ